SDDVSAAAIRDMSTLNRRSNDTDVLKAAWIMQYEMHCMDLKPISELPEPLRSAAQFAHEVFKKISEKRWLVALDIAEQYRINGRTDLYCPEVREKLINIK